MNDLPKTKKKRHRNKHEKLNNKDDVTEGTIGEVGKEGKGGKEGKEGKEGGGKKKMTNHAVKTDFGTNPTEKDFL